MREIMMNLIEQLKTHEGFRDDYYQCTADKRTIGFGRNVDDNPFSPKELNMLCRDEFINEPMTEDEAEILLVNDVKAIHKAIYDRAHLGRLNLARQAVCVNMAFNMGVNGFFCFKNMLKAIELGDFEQAAIEMSDSVWHKRSQVGMRSNDLILQMATGEWQ